MSTLSHTRFSSQEADSFGTPVNETTAMAFAQQTDGLVPAEQLPPAADVLAQIFPPEEESATEFPAGAPNLPAAVENHSDEEMNPSLLQSPADPGAGLSEHAAATRRTGSRKLARILVRVRKLFGGGKSGKKKSEVLDATRSPEDVPPTDALSPELEARGVTLPSDAVPPAEPSTFVEAAPAPDEDSTPREKSVSEAEPQENAALRQESLAGQIPAYDAVSTLPELSPSAEASTHADDTASENVSPRASDEAVGSREEDDRIGADFTARDGDAEFPGADSSSANEAEPALDAPSLEPNWDVDGASGNEFAAKSEEDADTNDDHVAIVAAIERYVDRIDLVHDLAPISARELPADGSPEVRPDEIPQMQAGFHVDPDDQPRDSVVGCVVPPDPITGSSDSSQLLPSNPDQPSADAQAAAASFVPSDRDWSFEEKLASHLEWVQSRGTTGRKADFAGAELEGTELIGVNLRFADLHDANLRAADLLMADLRDACLVRTNFRDACLVGANLEAANLENASLESAMGLVPRQLAGTSLHEASLPPHIAEFEARGEFERTARTVHSFFVVMMSASALSWVLLWTMKDLQLLTNSSVLPFLHSPGTSGALPAAQICLVAPFALFILYLVFHFQLQHLWDLTLELPAVFPDGRSLDENKPRIVAGLLRNHFRWMNSDAPSTRMVEKAVSAFVAYWIVPGTLLLFWLRYLTLQEIHGTIFQELLVVAATGAALYSTTKVGRPAERWTLEENFAGRLAGRMRNINAVKAALVFLGLLTFLAAGIMSGVPHGKDRASQYHAWSVRRWAATVLWSVGIDPYANLTEAVISTPPPNWNGSDDQVASVKGARLNESNFRYAQGYRIFLANSHLWHTNFQGAFLSQADFRHADMGQSRLQLAILDQAEMNHANLDRSVLDGANLSRADLRAANLSYASLDDANLVDARLDGATLYGARMRSATLIRTNFEKADLREASLAGANLEHADLQGAYLWSAKLPAAHLNNAQLGAAIFVDADLRGADLRWAQLPGAILTGADLTGAILDGADLRGAVGFGANQVCSAKSRQGVLLDPAVQDQVKAQCGAY